MKEISKYLFHFIENILLKKNKQLQTIMFSNESKKILLKYYDLIKKSNNEWLENKQNIIEENIDFIDNKLPKGDSYDYIPETVRTILENREKYGKKYTFSIGSTNVILYLIYPFSEDDPIDKISYKKMDKYLNDCLHKIYMWLYIVNNEKTLGCSRKINIYLYLSELCKWIPDKNNGLQKILEKENVNTAFTTSCMEETTINLFREEEWFKVFIHECFHCFGLDFSGSQELIKQSCNNLNIIFPHSSNTSLYESYCELWGNIFNILFYVYFENNTYNNKQIVERIEYYMQYENIFSCFQSVKVLDYYNIKYEDLYTLNNNNINNITSLRTITERNILFYYTIKSLLMFSINDFLKWIYYKNNKLINFIDTIENMNDYCNVIISNYKNTDYLKLVSTIEKWLSINGEHDTIENKTLKMVILEE